MIKRNIFFKKKINTLFIFITFLLFIFISYFILENFLVFSDKNFVKINEYKGNFYTIPVNTENEKVPFQNIRILEKSSENYENIHDLKYSIQLFSSSDLSEVKSRINYFSSKESFNINDLYIVALKHNLGSGSDYLLVYKDFSDRNKALNYCKNFFSNINNCLIVNIQNLD